MNKEQIDKMVRVDFCDNKEYRDKLYSKYKIGEEVKEEIKEQPEKE